MIGKIKTCNSKGFGFIETDKNIDFYFHHTEFKGDWKILLKRYVSDETITVEFDNDPMGPSGPRAKNVRMVPDA